MPNLLKYAFNLNPQAPDVTPMTITGTKGLPFAYRDTGGHLVITFVRRKSATNPVVSYVVETTGDMQTWSALDLSGAAVQSIDTTWERVTVTDPASRPRNFGHVRVVH